MTDKEVIRFWESVEKYARASMGGDSHFYGTFGEKDVRGIVLALRPGGGLDVGSAFMAATMAEVIPWQILKRAAELGRRMEEKGACCVEMVPGWCDMIDEQGEAIPLDDDEDEETELI